MIRYLGAYLVETENDENRSKDPDSKFMVDRVINASNRGSDGCHCGWMRYSSIYLGIPDCPARCEQL